MRAGWLAILAVSGCLFDARPVNGVDGSTSDARIDAVPTARITDGLIGLWQLDENGGTAVGDSSGVEPPVSPTIETPASVVWAPGELTVTAPVDINTGFTNNRLIVACKTSNELTLEAWVTPAVESQTGTTSGQPARIATVTTSNIGGHYLGLGQLGTTWAAQVKTSAAGIDAHGGPILAYGTVTLERHHLVVTSDATHRRLYVDGVVVEDNLGGSLGFWDPMKTLELGGDPNERNTWLGTLHLLAMYDRALPPDDVMQNYLAGP
jgi:hypothetical protein